MTHREAVLATLNHEPAEFVPGWSFFSTGQAQNLLLPEPKWDDSEYAIKYAQATGSSVLDMAGNMRGRVVEQHEHSVITELDNGTRRLIVFEPEWFYETLWRPLDGIYDLDKLHLPDVESYPDYWEEVRKSVAKYIAAGYYVKGTLDGFYAGIWEQCRRIDDFLIDLAEESDFGHALVDKWGAWKCECARKLLECGVDAIWWTDDMGNNTGPILSPKTHRSFFLPWHKRAADLAHSHGKRAMMHMHGNINLLLPHVVETGIDLLDPVGPSDGMNLKTLKETYGGLLRFSGGISRFIADMSADELYAHLDEVYRVGSRRGGFLPNEEGGVPRDMKMGNYDNYLEIRCELSRKYGTN